MPLCPKCRKLISANRYARHVKRCGTSHKHKTEPIREHSFSEFMMRL